MISFKSKAMRRKVSAIREGTQITELDPHLLPLPGQGEEVAKRQVRVGNKKAADSKWNLRLLVCELPSLNLQLPRAQSRAFHRCRCSKRGRDPSASTPFSQRVRLCRRSVLAHGARRRLVPHAHP